MSDEVPETCRPRLCHVVKWPSFQGYGFNLHAEKGKSGQYIGQIDKSSPAEAAGLKEGDRIVEVNGVNIGSENHQQVVARIKSIENEARFLVVDLDADNWYKNAKKVVSGDLPEIRLISAKRDEEPQSVTQATGHEENSGGEQHEYPHPEPHIQETISSSVLAPVHNGNAGNEDDSHRPRLCHLKHWPHFEGFGFNLHAEKDKPGQHIGLVDNNSPASTGGLKVNDRIIEVNGVNVEKEKHTEVIARIKAIPRETKLLVVDKETDVYYQKKGITVSSSMPQTNYIVTPDTADPPTPKRSPIYEEIKPMAYAEDLEASHGIDLDDVQPKGGYGGGEMNTIGENTEAVYENVAKTAAEEVEQKSEDALHEVEHVLPPPPSYSNHQFDVDSPAHHDSASATTATVEDNLELNLSVAEMKERLRSKKRQDPRLSKATFEEKFKEFQRM